MRGYYRQEDEIEKMHIRQKKGFKTAWNRTAQALPWTGGNPFDVPEPVQEEKPKPKRKVKPPNEGKYGIKIIDVGD